jgi:Asp-tRNA(Asn)/Glu-tRNA(Gln) amidotransferase A subunit family amidase
MIRDYWRYDGLAPLDTFALIQRSRGRFFERYDVLITPMPTQPPEDIGWLGKPAEIEEARPRRDQLPSVHVSNTTAAGPFARAASHRSRS